MFGGKIFVFYQLINDFKGTIPNFAYLQLKQLS